MAVAAAAAAAAPPLVELRCRPRCTCINHPTAFLDLTFHISTPLLSVCRFPLSPRTQDGINCDNKTMSCVLDALMPAGKDIVRARLAMRRLLPPNASPISDITKAGGWASLTGQELWLVSSVFPFLVAPIFEDSTSLVSWFLPSNPKLLPVFCFYLSGQSVQTG